MTKGSDAWDNMPIFENIKPCVFKNGRVQYYLNKNNFNYKEDGSAANLTGADGDVMIEIPKFGYKIYKEENQAESINNLIVSITDATNSDDFKYYGFSKNSYNDLEHFYWGAY